MESRICHFVESTDREGLVHLVVFGCAFDGCASSSSAVVTVTQEFRGVLGSCTRGFVGVWFSRDTPDTGVERVRGRVTLETDGRSHFGCDVLVAALLVAKRFGFEAAPLTDVVNLLMVTAEMVRVWGSALWTNSLAMQRSRARRLKLLPAHYLPIVHCALSTVS